MKLTSFITLVSVLGSALGSSAQQSEPATDSVALNRQLDAGFLAYSRDQNQEARRMFESARAALEALPKPNLELAVVLNMLTAIDTREEFGRVEWFERADRAVSRVVQIVEAILPPTHPDLARTLDVAALVYGMGSEEKADATRERWLGLLAQTLGPDHAKVAASRLLWQSSRVREPQAARLLVEQALKLQETSGDQPEIASVLQVLSGFAESQEERLLLVQRALAIRRAAPKQPYLEDIRTLGALIVLQAKLGQRLDSSLVTETVGHRERALQQQETPPVGSRYERSLEALDTAIETASLKDMALMGVILINEPKTVAHGEALFNLTIAAWATGFGNGSPVVAEWLRELAKAYRRAGRGDQARRVEVQAKTIEARNKRNGARR